MEKDGQNNLSSPKKISSKNSMDKNIEIAQALNQDELNNLPTSSELQSLSPDENISDDPGAPTEETQTVIQEDIQESEVTTINAEDLEGLPTNGSPQEGISSDLPEVSVEIDEVPPDESQTVSGAPSQGIEDTTTQISEENNIPILPPETSDISGEPLSDEIQNLQTVNDVEELPQTILGPEEIIADAGPEEITPESLPIQETVIAQEGPSETLNEGAPEEPFVQIAEDQELQENIEDNIAQLIPEEIQNEGNPQEVIGDTQQTDIAQVLQGPAEETISGNPEEVVQTEENIQVAAAIEQLQINPTNTQSQGNPEEGLTDQTTSVEADDIIAPEESTFAGSPVLQDPFDEALPGEAIELAEAAPIGPQEQGIQDYVNELAESVLEEKLEEGLSPQESAIAALQAGREAAKEVSSNSEEMNELAFNLGENLINDINTKIEDIQKSIKEKEQKKEEIQVAEATTEELQEVPEEQQVAEATTEETQEISEEPQAAEATTEELQEVPEEQQVAEATTEETQEVSEEPQAAEATTEELQEVPEEQQVAEATTEETQEIIEEEQVITEQELVSQDSFDQEVPQDQFLAQNESVQSNNEFELSQNLDTGQVTEQIETIDAIGQDQADAVLTEDVGEEAESLDETVEEEPENIEVAQVEETPIINQNQLTSDQELFSNNFSQISPTGSLNNQVSSLGGSVISSASSLGSQVLGFGTGTILSVASASTLSPVSNLSPINALNSSLDTVGQGVFSSAEIISPLGESVTDAETTDVSEIDTYVEPEQEEEIIESYTSEEVYEEEVPDESITYSSDIVNPTVGNDTLEGGLGETEFLYDFSVNVGGVDTLSDSGDNNTDRLFIKNIPEKHNILVTKDLGNNTINFETFDISTSFPYISKNVITTAISNGINGIEDLYLNTEEAYYNDTNTMKLEDFYNFGSNSSNPIGFVQSGSASDENFYNNYTESIFQYNYTGTLLENNPYSNVQLTNHAVFGREGNDNYYYYQPYYDGAYYANTALVNLGEDYDNLYLYSTPSAGSFFDGGSYQSTSYDGHVYDDYDYLYSEIGTSQNYGISSTNYSNSLMPTNFSLLTEQGNSSNINDVGGVYFKNFESVYTGDANDTFYIDGPVNDLGYIDGENGNDTFFIDNNFQATEYFSIYAGYGNDRITLDLDQNTVMNNSDSNYTYTTNINVDGGYDNDSIKLSLKDNTSLESDIYMYGGYGDDTLKLEALSVINNNNSYIYGGEGADEIVITDAINSNFTVRGGDSYSFYSDTYSDTFSFDKNISNPGLEIEDFTTSIDRFEFNSAAFSGNDGHTLVFGQLIGQEFFPNNSFDYSGSFQNEISAFDQDNNRVTELTSIDNDYWHFDTNTSKLYYDIDADQDLSNATEVATVQQSFYDSYYGNEVTNNLDEYTFSSSDITYDDDGTAI